MPCGHDKLVTQLTKVIRAKITSKRDRYCVINGSPTDCLCGFSLVPITINIRKWLKQLNYRVELSSDSLFTDPFTLSHLPSAHETVETDHLEPHFRRINCGIHRCFVGVLCVQSTARGDGIARKQLNRVEFPLKYWFKQNQNLIEGKQLFW